MIFQCLGHLIAYFKAHLKIYWWQLYHWANSIHFKHLHAEHNSEICYINTAVLAESKCTNLSILASVLLAQSSYINRKWTKRYIQEQNILISNNRAVTKCNLFRLCFVAGDLLLIVYVVADLLFLGYYIILYSHLYYLAMSRLSIIKPDLNGLSLSGIGLCKLTFIL